MIYVSKDELYILQKAKQTTCCTNCLFSYLCILNRHQIDISYLDCCICPKSFAVVRRLLQHRDGAAVRLNQRRASNDFCRSWFLGMSADIAGCSNCLIRMVFCEVTVNHRCTVTLILLTYLWIEPIQMFNSFMLESPVFNWLCCFLELPINVLHCKRAGVRSRTACSIS